ncbi:DUF86 domain-containing protein [soil metagenome]
MVDAPRLAALLQRIRDEVGRLGQMGARSDAELFADPDRLPAVKYRLIVSIEAATDVADHIVASEGLRPATSYADAFASLHEGGWIDVDLAELLAEAARFRNLLVHQYTDVDDHRVMTIVRERLGDLDRFVDTIADRLS